MSYPSGLWAEDSNGSSASIGTMLMKEVTERERDNNILMFISQPIRGFETCGACVHLQIVHSVVLYIYMPIHSCFVLIFIGSYMYNTLERLDYYYYFFNDYIYALNTFMYVYIGGRSVYSGT